MISKRRKIKGVVVSDKMDKTVVISVERVMLHPLYKKSIKKRKRYKIHDEKNECKLGDFVEAVECRPLSKDKKFRLTNIIKRSIGEVQWFKLKVD